MTLRNPIVLLFPAPPRKPCFFLFPRQPQGGLVGLRFFFSGRAPSCYRNVTQRLPRPFVEILLPSLVGVDYRFCSGPTPPPAQPLLPSPWCRATLGARGSVAAASFILSRFLVQRFLHFFLPFPRLRIAHLISESSGFFPFCSRWNLSAYEIDRSLPTSFPSLLIPSSPPFMTDLLNSQLSAPFSCYSSFTFFFPNRVCRPLGALFFL